LADNLYGSKINADSTVSTYVDQTIWVLQQHKEHKLDNAIKRGVSKELQDGKRYQGSLDLDFFVTLYSIVFDPRTTFQSQHFNLLKLTRNLLVYTFLGFAIQRSQSAVVQSMKRFKSNGRVLSVRNVRYDSARYAVWWGLTHSKGDPFGRRKGKDRIDWTVTAGERNAKTHKVDPVALYLQHCNLMGFQTDRAHPDFKKTADQPFFQELGKDGKPTGEPLCYNSLLRALKSDIREFFPDLDPADYATHSFRRFGASYAKTHGIPDDMIQFMGRWVSECFQRYFVFSDDNKVDISRSLLLA
jgi:hypothetical protein